MTTQEIQRALALLGLYSGAIDGIIGAQSRSAIIAFQWAAGLTQDGIAGPKTQAKLREVVAKQAQPAPEGALVPSSWFDPVTMTGIVFHWSGGNHTASGLDKTHYHIIIDGGGNLVRGKAIAKNAAPLPKDYAAHTAGHNSGIIGVSLACMAGAKEAPFSPGSAPMTTLQWNRLPVVLADLCRFYGIAPTRRNVLSHAEVQKTLGIPQKQKWDIAWTPGMAKPGDAIAIGDQVRAAVAKLI